MMHETTRPLLLLVLCLCACESLEKRPGGASPVPVALGDRKRVTLDTLYDPQKPVDFSGHPQKGFVWTDDEHYLVSRNDAKGRHAEWKLVEAKTGKEETFGDPARAKAAIMSATGVRERDANALAELDPARMTASRDALLFTSRKDLYVWLAKSDKVVRLTNTPDALEEEPSFSPDGKRVAFVRNNDLYVCDIDPPAERRLTRDGSATVLNGKLDWLYQEEVYGRGHWKSYWWSPDSSEIAFLQLDEKGVPLWTLVDDVPGAPVIESSPYPRAGEENPKARLGIVAAARPEVRWVDLSGYGVSEPLIVDVEWLDEERVGFQVQNREQSWLELTSASSTDTKPKLLVREESQTWVNANGSPRRLADGSFLWFSERTGWKHLYHYSSDGTLLNAVTQGEWEVRSLAGVDEQSGWIYFTGTQSSPIQTQAYRIRLDGSGMQRLTQRPGTHSVVLSPNGQHFLDSWSDLWTPTQVRLHAADGTEERVVDANHVAALDEYELARPELLEVKARDGFVMNAIVLKPIGFDPARRYPIFQYTYAGPHAPQVRNAWNGGAGMFGQLLAARGIVVWVCDNRSASGQGQVSEATCFQRLGESELADIEDGLAWLKSQPWTDAARIGIGGWSYGGFMTTYALTHSKNFCMGIAGGPVTDWRNYDSIYTERYMRLPKNNEKGYDDTSVVKAAKDLHGALLLVHGAMDDNVHPANTRQLANELQKEQKSFREMFYAGQRHSFTNTLSVRHWRMTALEFIERYLLGKNNAGSGN
ncbi:MAG: S9 family peptidase [Planctomycetes bacterium]|nr:S9 family peptidase [Planctomycetota bacterium]